MTQGGRAAWRFPALLLIAVLLAVAVVVERRETPGAAPVLLEEAATDLLPTVAPADSPSSTWYCTAGTAWGSTEARPTPTTTSTARVRTTNPGTTPGTVAGSGLPPAAPVVAEQTVTLTNAADQPRTVTLTVVPDEGERVVTTREVAPASRVDLVVSELVQAPFASVLVEADGGGIAAAHRVTGPAGSAVAPCPSRTSAQWFFPAGTTRLGSRLVYVVFNPFPDDAVLDLTFETPDETRTPTEFQGLVVPPGRVEAIDVTDVVTVRDQLATTVRARSGRVVAEQLQVLESRDDPEGITLVPGVPGAAPVWSFAGGPQHVEGVDVRYVVFNPSAEDADVRVEIRSDAPGTVGQVSPYELRIRSGRFAEVSLRQDTRVPEGYGHWAVVRSTNGVSVVAQRVVRAAAPAAPTGWTSVMGLPVSAEHWLVPVAGLDDPTTGTLEIVNPGTLPARLTVQSQRAGALRTLEQFDGVALAPGARTAIDLSTLGGGGALALRVEADLPVLAEVNFGFDEPPSRSAMMALPWRDRQVVPDPVLFGVETPTTLPPVLPGLGDLPLPGVDDTGSSPGGTQRFPTTIDGTGAPDGATPPADPSGPDGDTAPPTTAGAVADPGASVPDAGTSP